MQEKLCPKCNVVKAFDEFHNTTKTKSGKQSYCKPCQIAAIRKWSENNKERHKQLGKAWRAKNRERFNASVREYYHKNKHKSRLYESNNRVRRSVQIRCRKFGITAEHYWNMFGDQEGKCAICSKTPKVWWSFNVDHCHETGRIRGLLCGPCNKALGSFGDTVDGVKRAIAYLERSTDTDKGCVSKEGRMSREAWKAQARAIAEARDAELAAVMKPLNLLYSSPERERIELQESKGRRGDYELGGEG